MINIINKLKALHPFICRTLTCSGESKIVLEQAKGRQNGCNYGQLAQET